MVDLSQHGPVWILRMDDDENRFNHASVADLHAALDTVEAVEGDRALVTTGTGKYYSNGLDLDWVLAGDGTEGFIEEVHRLLGRVLGFPAYTVAAVNGHAFAGGAMLACAHDQIIMRADRGYWCLPEVDLGLPLTPAMYATVAAHLPGPTLAEAVLTGHRYGGVEACAAGIAERGGRRGRGAHPSGDRGCGDGGQGPHRAGRPQGAPLRRGPPHLWRLISRSSTGRPSARRPACTQRQLGRERVELGGPDVAVAALDDRALEEGGAAADLHGDVAHLDAGQGDLPLGRHRGRHAARPTGRGRRRPRRGHRRAPTTPPAGGGAISPTWRCTIGSSALAADARRPRPAKAASATPR